MPEVLDASGRPVPLSLATTAALVGGYRWIEHALYELLGSWVPDVPVPDVRVHLDAQSARHAWHAELWAGRLPVMDGADPDSLTVPPEAAAMAMAVLATSGPTVSDPTAPSDIGLVPRLAGLYRVVLPRLVVTYEHHLRVASPVTDGPLIRTLRLVLADQVEEWHLGERLVQRLVDASDVASVHAFAHRVEAAAVDAGVTSGLVVLPGGIFPG